MAMGTIRYLPLHRKFGAIHQGQRLSRRFFHVTSKTRFIDTCLSETHTLITGLHSVTGLPWAATLPLTALLIRFGLIAPLSTYAHSVAQRRQKNYPVLNAWRQVYQKKIMENEEKEKEKKGPKEAHRLLSKMVMKKSNEIYARTGTQRWKAFIPYLQFPIWLTAIETIRRMSGAQQGLVGLLQQSGQKFVTWGEPDDPLFDHIETKSMPSGEQGFEEENLEISPPDTNSMTSEGLEPPVVPIEPSFATEGALWFPDLLLPDPHLTLPFILSITLLANISHVEWIARQSGTRPTAFRRRLGNAFKIVAFAVGPLTLSMPSAIHVYWISSSVFALGYNALMHWYSPLVAGVKPCKERRFERSFVVYCALEDQKASKIRQERDRREKETSQAK
ncbi:MAG: hypothetical protein LQ339_003965 [Xanthoria mediterranea]|nr:MAG: hypothetical protein LQ339_003965 [Xanthoria mediterranea]